MTGVNNTIKEMLKERGHSNPKEALKRITVSQHSFDRALMIYKDPQTINAIVTAFRNDVEKDVKNIREAINSGEVDWDPSEIGTYVSKAQIIEQDIRSGKMGSISAVDDLVLWLHNAFDPGWGGNYTIDDIYPTFVKEVEKYLGERFYPDDLKGL